MRTLIVSLVLLAFVSPTQADDAVKVAKAKLDITNLSKAIDVFIVKRGQPPEELADLITAGFIENKASLLDPWGKMYQYDPTGPKNKKAKPDLWTITPDKVTLGNWPEEKK